MIRNGTSWAIGMLLMLPFAVSAQFGKVYLGVNGLTCSQCTRNVEMRLRRLAFVADVQMNLQHTDGEIRLRNAADLDPDAIARAVKDAGFSVRFLRVEYSLESPFTACFRVRNNNYQLVPGNESLKPQARLQFIGPQFMPAADYRKWKASLVSQCGGAQPVYFVTAAPDTGRL